MFNPCEIFIGAHLKNLPAKQASKHTHAHAQCNHAIVGLAQARILILYIQGCTRMYYIRQTTFRLWGGMGLR